MMEVLNTGEDANFESIAQELTRLRITAAAALKNIDSIYGEVLGSQPYREFPKENGGNVDCRSDIDSESPDEEAESSERNRATYDFYGQPGHNRLQNHSSNTKLCQRCHKVIFTHSEAFRPSCNIFNNEYFRQAQCSCCGRLRNEYLINHFPESVVQHPVSNVMKDECTNHSESRKNSHECPMKMTVPEPFQMTLREEGKKELRELKRQELKQKLQEATEKELRKKFHSNPVPGHTYLPMYQELAMSNEERKQKRKELAEKKMKECVRPFHITDTRKKSLRRADSMPHLSKEKDENTVMFKAKPLPKHILSDSVDEHIRYSETLRKERIRQRAEEMLKKSSLPFSRRSTLKKSFSAANLKDQCKTDEVRKDKAKPSVSRNKYVIKISHEDCIETMHRWRSKVSAFHASCRASQTPAAKFSSKSVRNVSVKSPLYDVPIRKTTACILREERVKNDSSAHLRSNQIEEWEENYEKRKINLKESLSAKLKMASLSSDAQRELERKLQEFRISRRNRQMEYERELKEMQRRIEKRPLLIERQGNKNKTDKESIHSDDNSNSASSSRTASGRDDGASNDSHHDSDGTVTSSEEQ